MIVGSVFSGIGGIELGLAWAGIGPVVWQVEIDPFARGVLAMHFPHAKRFADVKTVGRHNLSYVDLVCGGFPCQDVSVAGHGAGLDGERSGLWFEYRRIVEEIRPRFVVIENVSALVARGMDVVVGGLEQLGYRVFGRIIAAEDVGAPHRRERLFLVAQLAHAGHDGRGECGEGDYHDGRDAPRNDAHRCDSYVANADRARPQGSDAAGRLVTEPSPMADAHGERLRIEQQRITGRRANRVRDEGQTVAIDHGAHRGGRTQPGMGGGAYGIPDRVDRWPARPGDSQHVWEPPRSTRLASPTRAPRLHGLGNAVVPHAAYKVGLFVRELDKRARP